MSQNESKWTPKGSTGVKMCSKKDQSVSKCAQLGSKWLKMASTRVKMGRNGSKMRSRGVPRGPKGSTWPQNGLKYPKMAFSRPNLPKSSPGRVHPALQAGCRWHWDPSAEGTPARFSISAQKCTSPLPYVQIQWPPKLALIDI